MKYLLICLMLISSVAVAEEIKEECVTEKYVYTESIFIYDFKGWCTKVGDYPIDDRPGKECGKYGLSTFCSKIDDLFICACGGETQGYNELLAIIQDRRED